MNPKASLKSLKVKVRPIASRPGVSDQPGSSASADFRASADSRSAMIASPFQSASTLTPKTASGSLPKSGRIGPPHVNDDADVTKANREIC